MLALVRELEPLCPPPNDGFDAAGFGRSFACHALSLTPHRDHTATGFGDLHDEDGGVTKRFSPRYAADCLAFLK
jgi:hypothetical protein